MNARPPVDRPAPIAARRGLRERGQILVLLALSLIVLTGICAIVIDVSWYWANSLRVQRAADAAALAGAVWLPGAPSTAYSTARAEATKNGYATGDPGVTVTPVQDTPANPRRLNVTVSAPVGTYFMRIFGINTIQATRTAKAEFALPVPMGSPEQWYGVGSYEVFAAGPPHTTGPKGPTSTPNTQWTNPTGAYTANDGQAATDNGGRTQQYGNFGIQPAAGDAIDGIEVRVKAHSSDTSGCRIAVNLSWDNGASWTTPTLYATLTGTDPGAPAYVTLGGPKSRWGRTWTQADLANGSFRLRVIDDDPDPGSNTTCTDSATSTLDLVDAKVYSTGPRTASVQNLPTPTGESVAPTTQGFWGAVFTKGGVRRNGDRYDPASYDPGVANPDYDGKGVDYTVEFRSGASNGRVFLFDPTFCAVGANSSGSWYGAGDHWTTQSSDGKGPDPGGEVTTVYRLYNENNTPYDTSDDTLVATDSEGAQKQADQSGDVGAQSSGRAALPDCSSDPHHNQWVSLATGLAAGRYRLNVSSATNANNGTGAENLFSVYVGASGPAGVARVYGNGRMVGYNNITSSSGYQKFYLAQVDKVNAGKTMVIELFDPGDVGGDAFLRILSPDGNTYQYVTFNYKADTYCVSGKSDVCSASGRQAIQTANGGSSSFDNSVITIEVPLPPSYGSGGLQPSGETEPGWWKIEYQVGKANDTTTWSVYIRGNPVHLVVP